MIAANTVGYSLDLLGPKSAVRMAGTQGLLQCVQCVYIDCNIID